MRLPLSIGLLPIVPAGAAHAGRTWLLPQPQGHNLNDIAFLADRTTVPLM
jgi:hypothetical protein